jgi:RimJ/RimL family protein N-acetyltransferase
VSSYRSGEKISLRALDREDAPRIAGWFNDPEVTRNTSRYRPLSVSEQVRLIDRMHENTDDLVVGIVLKATDALIGQCGLHGVNDKNRRCTFFILIGDRSNWDQGYGSEATRLMLALAFDTLNLNRVQLDVFADNERAVRCYEQLGFRKEGVLRQHSFREGAYHDVLLMSMLRSEWSGATGAQ